MGRGGGGLEEMKNNSPYCRTTYRVPCHSLKTLKGEARVGSFGTEKAFEGGGGGGRSRPPLSAF